MSFRENIKTHEKDLILGSVIILVALISFGLGRLSKIRESKTPITITNMEASALSATNPKSTQPQGVASGSVVVSKNGTKYHYPWCSGAKRISEKNKVIFSSTEEARKAGYEPASNCKGLK